MKKLRVANLADNECIDEAFSSERSFSNPSKITEIVESVSRQCGFAEVPRTTGFTTRSITQSSITKSNQSGLNFDCGKSSTSVGLVTGGSTAKLGQWPFLVSLYDVDLDAHLCGGSLITNQHVLTGKIIY